MLEHGPIDVLALAFATPKFEGKVLAELEKRTADGTIRVLDAMVLLKDEKGLPWRLKLSDLPDEVQTALGTIVHEGKGLFDGDDATVFFEGMVPGSAIMALAIEHTWAVDLVNAIIDSGAEVAMNYRVPAVIADEAIAELE